MTGQTKRYTMREISRYQMYGTCMAMFISGDMHVNDKIRYCDRPLGHTGKHSETGVE